MPSILPHLPRNLQLRLPGPPLKPSIPPKLQPISSFSADPIKLKLKLSRYNTNRVILVCSSLPCLPNPQLPLALQSLPFRDLWSGLMEGNRRRGGESPFNAVAPGLVPGR